VSGITTIVGWQVWDILTRDLPDGVAAGRGPLLALGLIGLAEFVPTAVLSPFTGTLADRFERRRVVLAGLILEATAAAMLLAYAATGPTEVWPIYLMVMWFGATQAVVNPALRSLPVDMSQPHQLQRVVALSSAARQGASILGPVLAGFGYGADPRLPYAAAVLLLAVAAVSATRLPASSVKRLQSGRGARSVLSDARDGLSFVRHQPILLGAIGLDLFAVLFGGVIALLPAIADTRLGVGAFGLGWLRAAVGLGAAITTLLLAWKPINRHVGRILLVTVGLFGVSTLVIGVSRSFAVVFLSLFVAAGADSVSVFIRSIIVPLATPEEMRARVLAAESVFIGASNELGAFESGVTASLFGLVGAIFFGGFGTIAVVVAWWLLFPDLRDVDRFDEVVPMA
jgi:MFS family permease